MPAGVEVGYLAGDAPAPTLQDLVIRDGKTIAILSIDRYCPQRGGGALYLRSPWGMMADYEQALADIFGLFNTTWTANNRYCGLRPPVRWPGIEEPATPDRSKFWARVSQKTVSETQAAFRNGNHGQRIRKQGHLLCANFLPCV